jgi:hypothetical protein
MKPPDDPAEPPWTDAERMAWFEEKRRQKEPPPRRRAEPPPEQRLELSALSSEWAGRTRSWTESDRKSWENLTTLCREIEEGALRQEGVPVKRIKELVRTEFAWWDPAADDLAVSPHCPENVLGVPVVTSFKDGEFRIPAYVRNLLWDHPLLVDEIEKSAPRDQRDRFCRLLERIESIADTHDLHDWEIIPHVAEQDGPDQLAATCVMAEMDVRRALEALYGMGFADELCATSEAAGNTGARPTGQICVLLNATVELGRTLEHYTMSRNSRIEDTIRKMSEVNPGRGPSAEGEAVLKIVKAYVNEKSNKPTAQNLLKFLSGKKDPGSDGRPLIVDHPLWSEVLQGVSWDRFKTLVQSANRRL